MRVWFLWMLVVVFAGGAAAARGESHSWERVNYSLVAVPGVSGNLAVLVDSGSRDSVSHLRFSIHWGTSERHPDVMRPMAIFPADKITVRLHLSDGKIVSPADGGRNDWTGFGGGLGTDWSLMYFFPWSENKLEEAWIELRLPQQTYWIELPYGFTRDPSAPFLADTEHGVPEFPPSMKDLPAKDLLVPWAAVEYDLGAIQSNWRLLFHVSNPFTARAEVILYREEGQWDLHTPRTALEIQWPGGHSGAHCVGIRLTDVFRRTDDYLLGGGPGQEKGRIWARRSSRWMTRVTSAPCPRAYLSILTGLPIHTISSGSRGRGRRMAIFDACDV